MEASTVVASGQGGRNPIDTHTQDVTSIHDDHCNICLYCFFIYVCPYQGGSIGAVVSINDASAQGKGKLRVEG